MELKDLANQYAQQTFNSLSQKEILREGNMEELMVSLLTLGFMQGFIYNENN